MRLKQKRDDGWWILFRIGESSSNSLPCPQEASPLHISEIGSWVRNLLLKDSGLVTVIHSTPCHYVHLSSWYILHFKAFICFSWVNVLNADIVINCFISSDPLVTPPWPPCHCVIMFPHCSKCLVPVMRCRVDWKLSNCLNWAENRV